MSQWRFAVDRGGTFTDLLALAPDGRKLSLKLLSESPGQYDDAVLEGIRRMLQWPAERVLHEAPIESVRLGTTVATNALLEHRGAKVGLLLTTGFADLLTIGDQSRADLFSLQIHKPAPLYAAVATVAGRLDANGQELQPLDHAALRAQLQRWREQGVEAVAISLLHAWRNPEHELAAAEIAASLGFACVVCGHQSSPATRYLDRSHTAVVDAYLTPVVRRYINRLEAELGSGRLLLMRSDGALVDATDFRGASAVLSGPAGGATACATLAQSMLAAGDAAGHGLVGFDMGGTSTDVCVVLDGKLARSSRSVAGVRLGLPMLEVHTVAAGGGSVIDFIDGQLVVGPASAGAHPGPACYGRGGPATVTDANLLLGRLHAADLPMVFGDDGASGLSVELARHSLLALATRIAEAGGPSYGVEALAAGAIALADESMAQAVHGLTTARGIDPATLCINGFGGAAGQHLCGVAERLGASELCLHPYAGVLSAYGIGVSAAGRYAEVPLELALNVAALQRVAVIAEGPGHRAQEQGPGHRAQGPESGGEAEGPGSRAKEPGRGEAMTRSVALRLRLEGGGELAFSLALDLSLSLLAQLEALEQGFADRFEQHFGYPPPTRKCVIAALVIEDRGAAPLWPVPAPSADGSAAIQVDAHDGRKAMRLSYYRHAQLGVAARVTGPALVSHPLSTLYLAPGWQMLVQPDGLWRLRRERAGAEAEAKASPESAPVATDAALDEQPVDPVHLALYHHRFMHIAEQMGEVLQASARSVNIRERLDYSCALFDRHGQLIANAPHMPVHLGSMGESVRAVLREFASSMRDGDAYLLNDPYQGGTHLPDLTVVSPAFDADGALLALFASRAHHADVGGLTPGSMPADSRSVVEEGVLVPPTIIARRGSFDRRACRALFAAGDWPSRDPDLNVGEIEAQLAANRRGQELFNQLLHKHGRQNVDAYLGHVLDHTESLLRERIRGLGDGEACVHLDQGLQIQVRVRVDALRGELSVDFSGTSAQSTDNFNAPSAVVRAAVLYSLRCLLAHPVPLNEGFARPLRLILPPDSLVSPNYPAAVVAGNVETSQAITDALLLALGAQAASQGTMNNLSFGAADWQYYETVCGGSGAGPGFAGCDAVHTHMTNSRITDPEVLERRFPLRLERFEIRAGSGGRGRWSGGNGVIRRIAFLQPVQLSILASRRKVAPPGLAGGGVGATGQTLVINAEGTIELRHAQSVQLAAGEVLELRTPGGAGYGVPD